MKVGTPEQWKKASEFLKMHHSATYPRVTVSKESIKYLKIVYDIDAVDMVSKILQEEIAKQKHQ